ncbi:hypothetical protein [Bartonella bovis]|uniref:Putative membrane protein n=1 Tax=Bartonella bovis 91-4 TaxID=1094491 RepID=N6UP50_9HYPH|nr:hypothetical protein [Bartonella bovis]ENN91953.1 putative membrane protein [Bartonella bovis 91-4]
MFKKIRVLAIYITGFVILWFLKIEKNTEFIQAVLIFSSIAFGVTMTFMAAFFNSRLASELHHNPEHQHKTTTDLNILTDYLRKYLYSFLYMVFIALLLLLFPSNLRQEVVLPLDSKWEFHFYWDVLLWYSFLIFVSDIAFQMHSFINNLVNLFNLNGVYSSLD